MIRILPKSHRIRNPPKLSIEMNFALLEKISSFFSDTRRNDICRFNDGIIIFQVFKNSSFCQKNFLMSKNLLIPLSLTPSIRPYMKIFLKFILNHCNSHIVASHTKFWHKIQWRWSTLLKETSSFRLKSESCPCTLRLTVQFA